MDLVGACRVFVHVGERGSFTLGAAAAQVPQSVASRRIAALEDHFGERLFDRSTRRAALTAFGRDMLPSAKRLVLLAEAMEYDAERAKLAPLNLAVPETCSVRRLAALDAAAREEGTVLDLRPAGPAQRAELLRTHEVRAALLAVPPADAEWAVPLGVASRARPDRSEGAPHNRSLTTPAPETAGRRGTAAAGGAAFLADGEVSSTKTSASPDDGAAFGDGGEPFRLESLRPGRVRRSYRRIWIQPEDDVTHIRDRLEQIGHRVALVPAQIMVAASLVAAVSETMRAGDMLLCSAAQAAELGLPWRPLAGAPVARGYTVSAVTGDDAERIRARLGEYVAGAVGAPTDAEDQA